jgi:hypothetical protein
MAVEGSFRRDTDSTDPIGGGRCRWQYRVGRRLWLGGSREPGASLSLLPGATLSDDFPNNPNQGIWRFELNAMAAVFQDDLPTARGESCELRLQFIHPCVMERSSFREVRRIVRSIKPTGCKHDQRPVAEGVRIPRLIGARLPIPRVLSLDRERRGQRGKEEEVLSFVGSHSSRRLTPRDGSPCWPQHQSNQPRLHRLLAPPCTVTPNGSRKPVRPSQTTSGLPPILIFMHRIYEDHSSHFVQMPSRKHTNRKAIT